MLRDLHGHIGVMDSGVGGISVLSSLVRLMPGEDYEFFGDSANAPYGDKPEEFVRERMFELVSTMVGRGAKAIVIACNTATSIAAQSLREAFPHVPIVGMEPALKPASQALEGRRILVMATSNTLRLDKFKTLLERHGAGNEVLAVPCPGLAARIEKGSLDAPDVLELIESLVGEHRGGVDGVVLGCTHYSFVRPQIRSVVGDVPFFDGNLGTAQHLRRSLGERGLLADEAREGSVHFASSINTPAELELYRRFFALPLEDDTPGL